MARKEKLNALFDLTLEQLTSRIQSGEAKPQDFSNAIKFLKDNGIESLPEASPNLTLLKNVLPDFAGPDDTLQ
jgi:hypothetical protein